MHVLKSWLSVVIAVWTLWDLSLVPATQALSWELMENTVTVSSNCHTQEMCGNLQVSNRSSKQQHNTKCCTKVQALSQSTASFSWPSSFFLKCFLPSALLHLLVFFFSSVLVQCQISIVSFSPFNYLSLLNVPRMATCMTNSHCKT
jgi:hypothetical protein